MDVAKQAEAFETSRESLAQTILLAQPRIDEKVTLFTDASDISVGAALQEWSNNGWEFLAFFSKKLSLAECKYGTFDSELAIYLAMKHFRYGRGTEVRDIHGSQAADLLAEVAVLAS